MQTQTQWKCKRVHTSHANARRERYASALEVFFLDGRQWLSFCRYTRAGSERRCKLKKVKSFLLLALTLTFALAFAFVEVLLVWLIDRGRCVYWSYHPLSSCRCATLELKNILDKWLESTKDVWIWCVQAAII